MKIVRASVYSLGIPLTVPYTIAYVTISETVNHFLVLENSDGVVGIGCAAPAPDVTGETPEMSLEALNQIAAFFDRGDVVVEGDDFESETILEQSEDIPGRHRLDLRSLSHRPSAMTALDMALADMSARAASVSCARWMGAGYAHGDAIRPVTTSVTIGISSIEETMERARLLTKEGFHFLKIKGGHDVRVDISRLENLRHEFGPDLALALDANQGYSLRDIDLLQKSAELLKLTYLEQPTPKSDLDLLGRAAAATTIPVMADEAVQTEDDARRIGDLQTIRLINIKLQKMGGLKLSSRIDATAKEAGMRTMLGCMDESALSIAAALHFGAAHPNVQFYDLDGHLDLSSDPFDGLVRLDNGQLLTSRNSGLGWESIPAW
jgi:L-alanine-DL-glutamate epimerase-like enolase superfamily enzyme